MLTGVSRVYVGVHYPGDILGGFLLGMFNSRSLLISGSAKDGRLLLRYIRSYMKFIEIEF